MSLSASGIDNLIKEGKSVKDIINALIDVNNPSYADITKLSILSEHNKDFRKSLTEASLNRVFQHVKGSGENSWAILSAYKGGFTPAQNRSRSKELESLLRNQGLGFFKLEGHWLECPEGVSYEECPEGDLVDVTETSLFIPGISQDVVDSLARKFKQDAYIYSGPDTNSDVLLQFVGGGSPLNIGSFKPWKVAQAYSRVKGKPFVFEGFTLKPSTYFDNLIEMEVRNKIKNDGFDDYLSGYVGGPSL